MFALILTFRVVDIGWDDGATTGDLRAHKFRLDLFAESDEFHLWGDDAVPGIVHLGHSMTAPCAKWLMSEVA